jgi:hypothetical protein
VQSVAVFEIRLSNLLARKLQNYNTYIDSIEKIWQKSLVRINCHWLWATGPLLKSMTAVVVSSNTVHGSVYMIQHYAINFVSDLRQVSGFLGTPVSSTNKTDLHDITEILLKVMLNSITSNPSLFCIISEDLQTLEY